MIPVYIYPNPGLSSDASDPRDRLLDDRLTPGLANFQRVITDGHVHGVHLYEVDLALLGAFERYALALGCTEIYS